jgi:glutaminyl-peptide cyclotransferase
MVFNITKKNYFIVIILISILIINHRLFITNGFNQADNYFDNDICWNQLENYSNFSPVLPNSEQNMEFLNYSKTYFESIGWGVEFQNWTHTNNVPLHNMIARSPNHAENIIILGAHYDARTYADKDPDISKRTMPVPGINDGGSGTAILLELARVLDIPDSIEIWIILFDAEDQGGIGNWTGGIYGYCIGSTFFANNLNESIKDKIRLAIILDIVGGQDMILRKEASSNGYFKDQIWNVANLLGFTDIFINNIGSSIIDDHTPFLNRGIPAVDIIQQSSADGQYSFFQWHHTTNDTIQNCDQNSLYSVGRVIETFLENIDSANLIPPPDLLGPILIISIITVSTLIIITIIKRRNLFSRLKE